MNKTVSPPDLGRSSATQFLEEHDQLVSDLMIERDENRQLQQMNTGLLSENTMLHERLRTSEERILFFQGFTRTVITRFDVIREALNALEMEARDHGIKFMKAKRNETPEERAEAEAARQIISKLTPISESNAEAIGIPENKF